MRKKIPTWGLLAAALMLTTTFFAGPVACEKLTGSRENNAASHATTTAITKKDVAKAQIAWGESLVAIGKTYLQNGDYKSAAAEHINIFYNYQAGPVLFKPTLASEQQFRTDLKGALSYFVGGDPNYPEDHGFAIKPWKNVRWENIGTSIVGSVALAMGNYYFTPVNGGDDVKVEYSFAYIKDNNGKLKIVLHDSHLPYKPVKESAH